MKKNLKLSILLVVLILSACTSNGPLAITIVPPLATATKTPVPSITPTETPTFTPSPTPDLRVINTDPRLMILTEEEIDVYFDYGMYGSVPAYQEYGNVHNPYTNFACMMGYENAVDFLDSTGLVTGWITQYIHARTSQYQETTLPSHFEFDVYLFKSVEGPRLFMEEWDSPCEFNFYEYVSDLPLGEEATFCKHDDYLPNGEYSNTRYRLAIRYRNIYLGMRVSEDPTRSLDLNNFFFVADLQLKKFAELPLVDEVTLAQDFGPGVGCAVPPTDVPAGGGNGNGAGPALGWCLTNIGPGGVGCASLCMEECPEGSECLPCTLSDGPSIGSPPLVTLAPGNEKE